VQIDSSEVDTSSDGTYTVYISAADSSGNTSEVTRTVVVNFMYSDGSGIIPAKRNLKVGSANPLRWAWLDGNQNPVDSSNDMQILRIEECGTGVTVFADDTGSSDFRFKIDNFWLLNWDTEGYAGNDYCAFVTSSRTGQTQSSPSIRLR
jgi:hypothetical protein